MNPSDNHPDNIQAFVDGELSEAEAAEIISHMIECDTCLNQADTLWANRTISGEESEIPDLDAPALARVEGRVLRQIRRSDLGGRAMWLGTVGLVDTYLTMLPSFATTCLAMLRPFLTLSEQSNLKKDIGHD